ncbi:hypothetical protein ACA910_007674 [Epithemia clementina (nom. ined.)]
MGYSTSVSTAFDPADYTSWWTILFFFLHWAVAWTLRGCILRGWILPRYTRLKLLDLWERRKRNVLTYMVSLLVTTCALIFQVYGGWSILLQNYTSNANEVTSAAQLVSQSDIQWSTFSIQLICILMVWELIYRERIGWPLLLHHGLTLLFLQLLIVTYIAERQSILYLRFALLVAFFVTTNQLSLLSLICFRLKVLNPKIQRILFWFSAVQMFIIKSVLTGGCAGYYFLIVFSEENENGDNGYITFEDTAWGNFWRYMFLPVLFQTFVSHFYVCQLLLNLSQRQMTIIRPGMSVEALERMQREYRLAFLTLEAYENAPSSSSWCSASSSPKDGAATSRRRHYQTLLGSHSFFSNNYYYNTGGGGGGRKLGHSVVGGASRSFGFYGADQDIPTTWNDVLSAYPSSRDENLYDNHRRSVSPTERLRRQHRQQQPQHHERFDRDVDGTDVEDGEDESLRRTNQLYSAPVEVDTASFESSANSYTRKQQRQQQQKPSQHVLGALDVRRLFSTSLTYSNRSTAGAAFSDDAASIFHKSFGKDQQEAAAAAWSPKRSPSSKTPKQQPQDDSTQSQNQQQEEQQQEQPKDNVAPTSSNTNFVSIRGSFMLTSSSYTHQPPLEDVPEEEGPTISKSSSSNNSSASLNKLEPAKKERQSQQKDQEQGDEDDDLYAQSSPSSSSASSYIEPPPSVERDRSNAALPFAVIDVASKTRATPLEAPSGSENDDDDDDDDDGGGDEDDDGYATTTPRSNYPRKQRRPQESFDEVNLDDDEEDLRQIAIPDSSTTTTYDEASGFTRIQPFVVEPTRSRLTDAHHSVLPAYSEHLDLEANSSSLVEAPTDDTTNFELPGDDYDVYQMRT